MQLQRMAAPGPSARLVGEVYDCFMQSSRKELGHLLSVLLNASAASVLERVRAEARRLGALVASTSSWQQLHCTPRILDLCFAFLRKQDLRNADAVCRRWHCACKDGAGWTALLSREPRMTKEWARELKLRRIDPARLLGITSAQVVYAAAPAESHARAHRCSAH